MDIARFFQHLWADYTNMAPQAAAIHALFARDNPQVDNDHVAFRTFDRAPIRLADLEPHLSALGYQRFAPYRFEDKKLDAWGYIPPEPHLPRVFLSELRTRELSPGAQAIIDSLVAQVDPHEIAGPEVFWAGRLWAPPGWDEYQALLAESEYAAWVAAIGLRCNHFTIAVNRLHAGATLQEVVSRVQAAGFRLNTAGGIIKGSPAELLEQSATLADRMPVRFANGEVHEIPTCYYEFARRYPAADGQLYQGFVAASADKIFESTHSTPGH